MIEPTKLAWMAGVVDFKGRIVYRNNQQRAGTPQISLVVQCKLQPILDGLGELTGNTPEMLDSKPVSEIFRTGCKEHCPDRHVCVDRDGLFMPKTARWSISGGPLHVVLHSLLPYLVVDRNYDQIIREIVAATPLRGQGSAAPLAKCAVLMQRGWPIPSPYREVLETRLQAAMLTMTNDLELESA